MHDENPYTNNMDNHSYKDVHDETDTNMDSHSYINVHDKNPYKNTTDSH